MTWLFQAHAKDPARSIGMAIDATWESQLVLCSGFL